MISPTLTKISIGPTIIAPWELRPQKFGQRSAWLRIWNVGIRQLVSSNWIGEVERVGSLEIHRNARRMHRDEFSQQRDGHVWEDTRYSSATSRMVFTVDTGFILSGGDRPALRTFDVTMIEAGQYDADWPRLGAPYTWVPEQGVGGDTVSASANG